MLTRKLVSKEAQNSASVAAILNKCLMARSLSETCFRHRHFVLASVSVLEVMADRQPYRFEPERVPNAEDRERENEK